jgi:regulator of replication initiation timing
MSEDLALAVSKLKSMEALAKQLTEENYRLRLEQAEERPTASGLLKQTG